MARCKCGGIPKKGTPPIVTLRLHELASPGYFVAGVFISLPPPPSIVSIAYGEGAETFCRKNPDELSGEFAPYDTAASTAALKRLWYKSCECAPEQGNYDVTVRYQGYVNEPGEPERQVIFDGAPTYRMSTQPRNLSVVPVPLTGDRLDYRLLAQPPGLAPYFVGTVVSNTDSRFRLQVDAINVVFEPSGCYSSQPPSNPDTTGDYPSYPSIPFPSPPPIAYIPPEKEKPARAQPPTPPDDCCDCC
jgi:hypothetical protein